MFSLSRPNVAQTRNIFASVLIAFSVGAACAADITATPPPGGNFVVKNSAASADHLRIQDSGTVFVPPLGAQPTQTTPVCVNTADGQLGTCAASGVGPVAPKPSYFHAHFISGGSMYSPTALTVVKASADIEPGLIPYTFPGPAPVPVPANGTFNGFTIKTAGLYWVQFAVRTSGNAGASYAIFNNGTAIPGTQAQSMALESATTTGQTMVQLAVGDVISLRSTNGVAIRSTAAPNTGVTLTINRLVE